MEEVLVRRSVADDFAEWFVLFDDVAAEGRWIGREAPLDRTERRVAFTQTLQGDDAHTFVAERDGVLVGALGAAISSGMCEFGMMVRERHRGSGVGSLLVASCLAWCRTRDVHKVALTVWPHNGRAIALYRKFGFEVEGRLVRHHRRRNGELWDVLSMGVVLDTSSPGSGLDDQLGGPG